MKSKQWRSYAPHVLVEALRGTALTARFDYRAVHSRRVFRRWRFQDKVESLSECVTTTYDVTFRVRPTSPIQCAATLAQRYVAKCAASSKQMRLHFIRVLDSLLYWNKTEVVVEGEFTTPAVSLRLSVRFSARFH